MIRTGNLQSAYEPKFIPQSEIEYDALHLLKCYKPDYLNDIDTEIEDCIYSGDFLGVSDKLEVKNGDLAIVEAGKDRCKYVKRVYFK